MNGTDPIKHVTAIEAMQTRFEGLLASLNVDLFALLSGAADKILASPKVIGEMLNKFNQSNYKPVLEQFGADILTVANLNDTYFADAIGEEFSGTKVNKALFDSVKSTARKLITDQFGIRADGSVVSNGVFDLFSQDTTVQRQVQQFAYAQRAAGVGLERFKKNLKTFIVGDPNNSTAPTKGVWSKHYETNALDTYQQVDRLAQKTFAEGLNMQAFLYLGGRIAGSRPFCQVRDGKCFLKSEIDKFGTAQDAYGGYESKATGYFSGKPKSGYAPFLSLGGYGCRHHLSAVSDREAMRRRPDLVKQKGGPLKIQAEPEHTPANLSDYEAAVGVKVNRDIFKMLSRPVPMEHQGDRSYYLSGKNMVNIATSDRTKRSKWFGEGIIYHEYGHAVDANRKLRQLPEVSKLMGKYQKAFAKNGQAGYQEMMERIVDRYHNIDPSNYDESEQLCGMADTLQALNPSYGYGHELKYMRDPDNAKAEFMAHAFENYFIGNPVFEKEWPALYKETRSLIGNLLKEFGGD